MEKMQRKHQSTANTGKLVSALMLLVSFLLLFASAVVLFASLFQPDVDTTTQLLPDEINRWISISTTHAAGLFIGSIFLAWMGYVLRVLACLLETTTVE